jgi:hypothetical protein
LAFAGLRAFIAGCIDAPNRVVEPISSWVHSRILAWPTFLAPVPHGAHIPFDSECSAQEGCRPQTRPLHWWQTKPPDASARLDRSDPRPGLRVHAAQRWGLPPSSSTSPSATWWIRLHGLRSVALWPRAQAHRRRGRESPGTGRHGASSLHGPIPRHRDAAWRAASCDCRSVSREGHRDPSHDRGGHLCADRPIPGGGRSP